MNVLAVAHLSKASAKGYTRMKKQAKNFASLPSFDILSKSNRRKVM
jgi:hypothetical protein